MIREARWISKEAKDKAAQAKDRFSQANKRVDEVVLSKVVAEEEVKSLKPEMKLLGFGCAVKIDFKIL